jgi:hypothetical protein
VELAEPQQPALGVGVERRLRAVRHGPAVGGVVDEGDGGEEHVDGARARQLVRRLVALRPPLRRHAAAAHGGSERCSRATRRPGDARIIFLAKVVY